MPTVTEIRDRFNDLNALVHADLKNARYFTPELIDKAPTIVPFKGTASIVTTQTLGVLEFEFTETWTNRLYSHNLFAGTPVVSAEKKAETFVESYLALYLSRPLLALSLVPLEDVTEHAFVGEEWIYDTDDTGMLIIEFEHRLVYNRDVELARS